MILSMSTRHLCVDISSHGLGHVAQATAVLDAIHWEGNHDFRLTVRTAAPVSALRERIRYPFQHVNCALDKGMLMYDALCVNVDETYQYYQAFHEDYSSRVSSAARDLEKLEPDLVLSNVPYLSLDAASMIGVPSIALCSLNWADVFQAYCGDYPGSDKIYSDMLRAYSNANMFLQPTPSMPMPGLSNAHPISPIAKLGSQQPDLLRQITNRAVGTRFVLIAVGGLSIDGMPLETWPTLDDVVWIFSDTAIHNHLDRKDFVAQSEVEELMGGYVNLLSSSDLIVTKTGYGTQTEAVVNEVPAICINRHDWPEHENLRDWHEGSGEVAFVDWHQVGTRDFAGLVSNMLGQSWTKSLVVPNGAKEAAHIIENLLF